MLHMDLFFEITDVTQGIINKTFSFLCKWSLFTLKIVLVDYSLMIYSHPKDAL